MVGTVDSEPAGAVGWVSSLGGGSQPGALGGRRTEVLKLVEVLGKALEAKGQRPFA